MSGAPLNLVHPAGEKRPACFGQRLGGRQYGAERVSGLLRPVLLTGAMIAGLLTSSCSLLGLSDFPLTECTTNSDCEGANARFADLVSECQRFSCDPETNTCELRVLDEDGDGEGALRCGGNDCDDGDARRFSTNTESCDGVDNDCNEIVDDDVTLAAPSPTRVSGAFTVGRGSDSVTVTANEMNSQWAQVAAPSSPLEWHPFTTIGGGEACPLVVLSDAERPLPDPANETICGPWESCQPDGSLCDELVSCRLDGGACGNPPVQACDGALTCTADGQCVDVAPGDCRFDEVSVAEAGGRFVAGMVTVAGCPASGSSVQLGRFNDVNAAASLYDRGATPDVVFDLEVPGEEACDSTASGLVTAALSGTESRTLSTWGAGAGAGCADPKRFYMVGAATTADAMTVSDEGVATPLSASASASTGGSAVVAWGDQGWFVAFADGDGVRLGFVPTFNPGASVPMLVGSTLVGASHHGEVAVSVTRAAQTGDPVVALSWTEDCTTDGDVYFAALRFAASRFEELSSGVVGVGSSPQLEHQRMTADPSGASIREPLSAFVLAWRDPAGAVLGQRFLASDGMAQQGGAFVLASAADQVVLYPFGQGQVGALTRSEGNVYRIPACGRSVR